MKNLSFIFLLLVSIALKAQVNLVPNPSFEDYTQCPDNYGQITRANNWLNPTTTSPDYFNVCSTFDDCLVPVNYYGEQLAHNGNAYAGIALYYDYDTTLVENYREYLQIQLSSELESNKTYCVEFYFSFAGKRIYSITNSIGIFFSNSQPTNYGVGWPPPPLVNIMPQIEYNAYTSDTTTWIKFSGLYNSLGGENYLTIGNFNTDNQTDFQSTNFNPGDYILIYIDDISVIECDSVLPILPLTIPNVFTPNNDGTNDVFEIKNIQPNSSLTIYNRWGSKVYQSNNYQNNWDGGNVSDGVYYYILQLPFGIAKKGTVTILRN